MASQGFLTFSQQVRLVAERAFSTSEQRAAGINAMRSTCHTGINHQTIRITPSGRVRAVPVNRGKEVG